MSIRPISSCQIGDMIVNYELEEENGLAGFFVIPADLKGMEATEDKEYNVASMVQLKLTGDAQAGDYGNGSTYRSCGSSRCFKYDSQTIVETAEKTVIDTLLRDTRGYVVHHIVTYYEGDESFECHSVFKNESDQDVTLEMLTSFELGNITPFVEKDAYGTLLVHRLRSKWSGEGRLHTETVEDLQLERSWSVWPISDEKFGQCGSMPVRKFFPFVAVEDKKTGVLWGAQIAHEASWQIELFRQDDCLHISGGLADWEFGHWRKRLAPGEEFETPKAIVSVCAGGGIDCISQRLTQAGQKYLESAPDSEQRLPIIFNEYCTTWGCPSHENIAGILDAIKGKDFSYFVIDCGWFKEKGVRWDISMGDYEESKDLFPNGIKETVALIKDAGMKPGIWFEIDNIGRAAKAYQNTEHLLYRDGQVLETINRRFWDMRDAWVQEYLTEKVIGMLKKEGFEYIKMDYNDTIGIGCDGCESPGEGLRQNMDASVAFVKKIKEQVPGIIIENCASGGHKLEPLMMSLCSMASFSDAHECEEIPIVALNLHRAILPRQSQIWAVIRKDDSVQRIAYSIANTFLGRMCLSGDVTELSDAQWDAIDRGMEFYKEIAEVIKDGYTYRFGKPGISDRHVEGWQGMIRIGKNGEAFALIHIFRKIEEEWISIPIPEGCPTKMGTAYCDVEPEFMIEDGMLKYHVSGEMRAAAVRLTDEG